MDWIGNGLAGAMIVAAVGLASWAFLLRRDVLRALRWAERDRETRELAASQAPAVSGGSALARGGLAPLGSHGLPPDPFEASAARAGELRTRRALDQLAQDIDEADEWTGYLCECCDYCEDQPREPEPARVLMSGELLCLECWRNEVDAPPGAEPLDPAEWQLVERARGWFSLQGSTEWASRIVELEFAPRRDESASPLVPQTDKWPTAARNRGGGAVKAISVPCSCPVWPGQHERGDDCEVWTELADGD